jgi:hypothetical protein
VVQASDHYSRLATSTSKSQTFLAIGLFVLGNASGPELPGIHH